MASLVDWDGSAQDQSYFHCARGDMPEYLIPWHWIVSSTASSTMNSSNSEALYLSTPSSGYHIKDDIIGSGLAEASLENASNPSSALSISSTIQQYNGYNRSTAQAPSTWDTTPDGSENHHNSQRSPTDAIFLDSSLSNLTLESSKGIKPGKKTRSRRLLCETKDAQGRRTEPSRAKNDRYMKALERNRQAAAKCRARKQDEQDSLTAQVEELQDRHQQLSSCCNDLKEKVFQLKSQLLGHGDCECALIQRYVASEALKSVDGLISNQSSSSSWVQV
ncbi:hypothetical protein FOXG_22416 [Fusarium oxysporum f. sp. lycopersici 4287]|uniref:BZIP domain-containing protein n=1 Tax=Fusarium oxysporum f. sp. lycopersici (strain 4287 / CBS 123668 / FGSC 9935 / NRRL 34936) TaxID=426428 RepID=A0A0J9V1F4_FUSO4|nr:hypothetical protein FOXG_19292 [Fusarium oxysporum f. sp. lycopersici 4287]XP_018242726.1 hypothetical protein FOXG_19369 [Fusarium oxysporum f. sp. lycopersici 4287]XP_018244653.1 hypothetical protein FOXG_19733 [Fusarium oxysporum f. sp. lycopersici 4287]XP_018256951.1 uncharacterized protein FOXG_22416 [Fusarium oxysporum f. sp. lycopersici 4287]KAJ9419287.1 hypothetical protein QL093DRAFT_1444462 [Fusarium oxysporum]KNB04428.1 hypothetical protein FOXG_19292 [Fusarium oxysporum f. sp. 